MRRRVSREQLLDASQSILSPRGNPRFRGGVSSCELVLSRCVNSGFQCLSAMQLMELALLS